MGEEAGKKAAEQYVFYDKKVCYLHNFFVGILFVTEEKLNYPISEPKNGWEEQ